MRIIGITGLSNAGKDTVATILAPRRMLFPLDPQGNVTIVDLRRPWSILEHGRYVCAFADALKNIARAVWDFDVDALWGPSALRNEPCKRFPRRWPAHDLRTSNGLPVMVRSDETWFADAACDRCGLQVRKGERYTAVAACADFLTPRAALQQLGTNVARDLYPHTWVELLMRNLNRHGDEIELCVIPDVRFDGEAAAIRARGGEVWKVTRPGAGLTGAFAAHASEAGISLDLIDRVIENNGTLAELEAKVKAALG